MCSRQRKCWTKNRALRMILVKISYPEPLEAVTEKDKIRPNT